MLQLGATKRATLEAPRTASEQAANATARECRENDFLSALMLGPFLLNTGVNQVLEAVRES
jgi:hypothetical protein